MLQTSQAIAVFLRCPLTAGSRGSILAAPQRAEMRMKASLKTLAAHLADTTPPSDEANRVLSYMGLRVSVGVVGFDLTLFGFKFLGHRGRLDVLVRERHIGVRQVRRPPLVMLDV